MSKLNNVTVKNAYPIPNIETCLDTLGGAVFISTLDMASGYFQVNVDEHDKHKIAFVTKYGLYQYTKLPFGLCNSPATFSGGAGKKFEDQIDNLRRVFLRF